MSEAGDLLVGLLEFVPPLLDLLCVAFESPSARRTVRALPDDDWKCPDLAVVAAIVKARPRGGVEQRGTTNEKFGAQLGVMADRDTAMVVVGDTNPIWDRELDA